ncbi:hypothetical protein [Chryseobacterium sp. PET-29]|uniref:hypothetical protein n=1 Tax=Chryseobacterium sp. PET-29 TaxID=2983267 RepID=UPI0021E54AC2|nr:hypothetical protein [Chryseobacterium sp. PET-29]
MAANKRKKSLKNHTRNCTETFELEPIMKFEELTLEQSEKMLIDSGFDLTAEEVTELMQLLNIIAKITLKEVFSAK